MKLERLHESVLMTVVIFTGLLLAIVAGSFAGTGRTGMVGMFILGFGAVALVLLARERIWMIVPAFAMLGGQIVALPLPFSVSHIGVAFAFATFLVLKAFKIVRLKPKFDLVDFWMLLVLVYLGTVFIRNPVGVDALGSTRVGGRPYFNVAIACAACWVLSRAVSTAKDAFFVPLLIVAGHTFQTALNFIAYKIPSTIGPISQLYSGLSAAQELEGSVSVPGESSSRQTYWQGFGITAFQTACSYWRPFTIVNPLYLFRFLAFIIAISAVFLSGFRSALFACGVFFLVSTYFRQGIVPMFRAVGVCVLGLCLILAMQGTLFNLPFSTQRALSFLPGKWDYAAVSDARGSTEWRVEMWKEMMVGNRYVSNKWLGDGFGFTRQQLQVMNANLRGGTPAEVQENFLISGNVHSGIFSAIRFVGFVGLALFMIFLILLARRALGLIERARGTPFFTLALVLCIPVLMHPFFYIFIFGGYETDLPNSIMNVGMLKMLENSLDAYGLKAAEPIPLQPTRTFRRPPRLVPASAVR